MPKFKIVSHLTVVMEREWAIDADSEDCARELFEQDSDNATFIMEQSVKIVGDETVAEVAEA